MKKINLLLGIASLFLFIGKTSAQVQQHGSCATEQKMQELLNSNPGLAKDMAQFRENIQSRMELKDDDTTTIYTIPIVFHILHEYGAENISDAQVYSEVDRLNIDYEKKNADTSLTVLQFRDIAANARIQFALATIDPEGNCTNGIEHIYSHLTRNGDDYSKLNDWPRANYLNVWVVKEIGEAGVAGYAYYPSGVEGTGFSIDGVLILDGYIGDIGTSSPYTSRALTHEIGHYLGLEHPWGNTNSPEVACGNDLVEDTPITKGHLSCVPKDITCGNLSFPNNYMRFDSVSTTNGTTNLTLKDSVYYRIKTTPFKAVGLSANSTLDSVFAFSGWGIGAVDGLTDSTLLTGSLDPSKYYEVTVAPTLPYLMALTNMSFKINRSATGPRTYAVRSSADGFTSNLALSFNSASDTILKLIGASNIFFYKNDTTIAQNTTKVTVSGPSFTDLDTLAPVTFRIYAWNAEDAAGSFSIDNFIFTGKAGLVENVQNYMDYSYCSTMFTKDQVAYMRNVLVSITSSRNNLWTDNNHTITGTDSADVVSPPLCTPKADFHASTKYACEGANVTFTDFSWRAAVDSRVWTFEGGTPATSTASNPVVSFTGNGWHQVTLTVTNANGSDTETMDQGVFITTYDDFHGPFSESFDDQSATWWLVDNPEDNYAKFALVNGRGINGSSCYELNNYKDISDAQIYDEDYYYNKRLGENKDALISPNYDLSNTSGASMTFRYAYASNATTSAGISEMLKVYSTSNCGATWSVKKQITGTTLLTAGSGWADYIPNDPIQWKTATVALSTSSADHNIRFKFEFNASDSSNNFYIDDINITGTLGIPNNPLIDMEVNVYPNPVAKGNQLTVAYHANGNPMKFQLTDMTGRIVYEGFNDQTSGDVNQNITVSSTLATGIYSFRITDGNYFLDKKIVIQ